MQLVRSLLLYAPAGQAEQLPAPFWFEKKPGSQGKQLRVTASWYVPA